MKNVVLIYNFQRDKNLKITSTLDNYLKEKGINTTIIKVDGANAEWEKIKEETELAVILGGDGTLLGTSRILAPKNIPLFGINTGHLGFLTEGSGDKFQEYLDKVLNGEYRIEERGMLLAKIVNSKETKHIALNDFVINRSGSVKMLDMTLHVDGSSVADYHADGLIISTPTGSTAYALSAGGAVLDPGIEGIEIVPICAHSLTNRPHVISDKREIKITFNSDNQATLQVDGQESFNIKPNNEIIITRSEHNTKLVRLLGQDSTFYSRVKEKFHIS